MYKPPFKRFDIEYFNHLLEVETFLLYMRDKEVSDVFRKVKYEYSWQIVLDKHREDMTKEKHDFRTSYNEEIVSSK